MSIIIYSTAKGTLKQEQQEIEIIIMILKGHSQAILVHFKNKKDVLTSMNAHK